MATPGKLAPPEIQQKIANQYLAGVGVTQIAKEVGASYASVRELLLRKKLLRHAADFPLSRFETRFVVTPGCWLWTGEIGSSGYGRFYAYGRKYRAHRFSYEAYKGEIPKGMLILHSCDNPRCVNPDHLRVGTDADNTRDKMERGRFNLKRKSPARV